MNNLSVHIISKMYVTTGHVCDDQLKYNFSSSYMIKTCQNFIQAVSNDGQGHYDPRATSVNPDLSFID